MEHDSVDELSEGTANFHEFTSMGLEKLDKFRDDCENLKSTLLDIKSVCGSEGTRKVDKLISDLEAFEPSITMIGQIKAGKTSLVNAMIGRPELLPADVNPWTSVVTSLHLNTPQEPNAPKASFQFFDRGEWDHLVQKGGRIGELSLRAGAEDELQKVHEQINQMFEKTQMRLGRKFELMLGQKHNYNRLDEDLVQRYVCMGDDFEQLSEVEQQGRFADITKSADLYLDAPSIPVPLCIRDTPGVNDTFMVREQITIQSLRQSKICVVVLSASQALSSIDMGLIRLVSNVKTRQILIFVNRIDELSDPTNQLPDIKESILNTLEAHNGPKDVEIVFGSAYWANLALTSFMDDIHPDSAKALENCAQALVGNDSSREIDRGLMWQLSGMPELFDSLSERICEGEGSRTLVAIRTRAENLVRGLLASNSVISLRLEGSSIKVMDPATLEARLEHLERQLTGDLESKLDEVFNNFAARIDQSHKLFLERALESLLQHLEKNGEDESWQYSPEGLRVLMRSGFQVMRKRVKASSDAALQDAAKRLTDTYCEALAVKVDNFSITAPNAPELPDPVSLGQTIALDLQTSWWKGWWQRRKGYRAFASGFYDLIHAETLPIVDNLKITQANEIREIAARHLQTFLAEQHSNLMEVIEKNKVSVTDLNKLYGITEQKDLMESFKVILEELDTGEHSEDNVEEAAA